MPQNAFSAYKKEIQKALGRANATEHTHRPALKTLIESLAAGIIATNEPKRVDIGAPDFVVTRKDSRIGFIETKDCPAELDKVEKSEQLLRYRACSNLILTDYLEFRWYTDGERRLVATLGKVDSHGKITPAAGGDESVRELLENFLNHKPERLGSPKELAEHMARRAHIMRDSIIRTFRKESEHGNLHEQLKAFQDVLIPDLAPEAFADMYAQTIAYGLFAARMMVTKGSDFTREKAIFKIPPTNPFLSKLFGEIAGPSLDERIAWVVDELTDILANADMHEILKNFGTHKTGEDAVIHFYETFLATYSPAIREKRGVYYTPEPVVSYIVRSIDALLVERFGKPSGLADDNVIILDPATGTGTFLFYVIGQIYEAFKGKGQLGAWNDYVSGKLLKRVFGFELLMAPYAVAHLKLGLELQDLGYTFDTSERLGVYLTNTLEEVAKQSEILFGKWLTEEANTARKIKNEMPIMVVLGNPPYSVSSANKSDYIERLMDSYKKAVRSERNIQPLSDDYIKFIRFAHDRIERTGYGIIGMITNNTYLSGLVHRGMREELLKSFDEIYILNLHGNARIGETAPDGSKDENVFDIMQGVSISIFVRLVNRDKDKSARVFYKDLFGLEMGKSTFLNSNDSKTTKWQQLKPTEPYYFFIPFNKNLSEEYDAFYSVDKAFSKRCAGLYTSRDSLTIHWSSEEVFQTINDFTSLSVEEARAKYQLGKDADDWKISLAQEDIQKNKLDKEKIVPITYRPFDNRYTFYTGKSRGFMCRPRPEVMRHMLAGENFALLTMRQYSYHCDYCYAFVTRDITECRIFISNKGYAQLFPLYLYPDPEKKVDLFENEAWPAGKNGRQPNLSREFVSEMESKLSLTFIPEAAGDLKKTIGPEDIFNYIYAIFHSPTYRSRYSEFLKIDFPRVSLTSDIALFRKLVTLGSELVGLHLMSSPKLEGFITTYNIPGTNTVEKVRYSEPKGSERGKVWINKSQYFEGIDEDVWNFHIGGYQVLHKWLKDRKGRTLSSDDIKHYQKIIVATNETMRIMGRIEEAIPNWPLT